MMKYLLKPFEFVAGTKALTIGAVVALLSIILCSLAPARFDGALDFHIGVDALPIWKLLLEQIMVIFSLFISFYAGGKLLGGSGRAIDMLGTSSMARIPMLLIGLVSLALPSEELAELGKNPESLSLSGEAIVTTVLVSIPVLALYVYYVALLWQAFKTCFNLSAGKAVAVFILSLITAEIISKLLITIL